MGFFKKLLKGDWSNPFDNIKSSVRDVYGGIANPQNWAGNAKNFFSTAWDKTWGTADGLGYKAASVFFGGNGSMAFKDWAPLALDAYNTHATNVASARQAKEQMEFQERMSSTSYQRAMADMAKAGLNPSLAYQQGGASTPGGAQAPVLRGQGAELAQSAIANASLRRLQSAQAKSAEAAARNTDTDTSTKEYALKEKLPKEVRQLVETTNRIKAETGAVEAQSALYTAQRDNRVKELEEQAARIVKLKHEGKSAEAQAAYDVWRTKGQMALAPTVDEGIEVLQKWLHDVIHSDKKGYRSPEQPKKRGEFTPHRLYQNEIPFDSYQGK